MNESGNPITKRKVTFKEALLNNIEPKETLSNNTESENKRIKINVCMSQNKKIRSNVRMSEEKKIISDVRMKKNSHVNIKKIKITT